MTPFAQLALIATVTTGNPEGSCPVRVVPANAPAAWVSAASALERTLHDATPGDRDCREVVVHAAPDASVEVTTSDGRRGVRRLAEARDLEPTVTALIVTVPTDLMAPPALTATAAPTPAGPSWRLLMFAGGGGRLTLPSAPSPVLDLMVGTVHRNWELAVYGSWTPTVWAANATARAGFSSTAEAGLSAARRASFRSLDLIVGGRATAIALWGHDTMADQTGAATGDFTDTTGTVFAPALSTFVGASIPFLPKIRLRPQAFVQWIPLGLIRTDATSSIWSVGLGIGAESGTP